MSTIKKVQYYAPVGPLEKLFGFCYYINAYVGGGIGSGAFLKLNTLLIFSQLACGGGEDEFLAH